MSSLVVGVAGLGRIGKIHLENLLNHIEGVGVLAASDPSSEARRYAEDRGIIQTYETVDELIKNTELEAIVICSPTDQHASHVIMAAKAEIPVFCEKPLDLSLERVKETLRVINKTSTPLMVGFNRRFDPSFAKVKRLVAEGAIGDVHMVRITSRDPSPPPIDYVRRSGGLFLDMSIHDFDMARFLVGSEVVEVYAQGANLIDPAIGEAGDIDTAVTILRHGNGATTVIDNSRQAVYGYDQRIEVFGSKGMAKAENETPDRHRLYTQIGVTGPLPEPFFLERYAKAYREEMAAFVQAVVHDEEMPVTGYDVLQATSIALAAEECLHEKRALTIL